MPQADTSRQLSIKEKLFLVLVVPATLILGLELICRFFHADTLFAKSRGPIDLEMPTWMQNDPNLTKKVKSISGDEESIDWLSMFEEGSGFRVRLIPDIEKNITNTFSQITSDKQQKYLVRANSLGFRGPELSKPKDPSLTRILVFGDSSSFGWGVNQDDTFSSLLQDLIDVDAQRRIEVGNFAIPGDSSEYGRLIFDRFASMYQPDIVILGFGANDAKLTYFQHQDQVERFKSQLGAQRLKQALKLSALFRTLENLIASRKEIDLAELPKRRPAVPKKRFIENLQYMAQSSVAFGARGVMLLSLCTPTNYSSRVETLAQHENYLYFDGQTELIRNIPSIAKGAIHSELVNEMREAYGEQLKAQPLYYVTSDACHPNKLGHRLIAERIAEKLQAAGLLHPGHDTRSNPR